jgi:general secretion pathway protein A
MLIGQPELLTLLAKDELRQLTQRVTARFHLDALNREVVHEYIKHRLKIAGARGTFFPAAAVNRIFKISEGVPRVVNLLCDRALLGTYAENRLQVSVRVVNKAAEEVLGLNRRPFTPQRIATAAALVGLILFSFQMLNRNTTGLDLTSGKPTQPVAAVLVAESEITPADNIATATILPNMSSPTLPQVEPEMSVYLDKVEDVTGHGDARLAFNDLFALWGVVFEDQSVHPCEQATSIGLKCFSNLSGLKEVTNLNRPIVIGLNQRWLTLSQVHNGVATLISGSQQFEVSLQELAYTWNGKYTLFWRVPPAFNGPLAQGDQGAPVDWLVNQMALIESLPPVTATGHSFDKQLEDRIKHFQLHSGLTPNGTVGVRTWIHMNGVQGVGIPFLSTGEG